MTKKKIEKVEKIEKIKEVSKMEQFFGSLCEQFQKLGSKIFLTGNSVQDIYIDRNFDIKVITMGVINWKFKKLCDFVRFVEKLEDYQKDGGFVIEKITQPTGKLRGFYFIYEDLVIQIEEYEKRGNDYVCLMESGKGCFRVPVKMIEAPLEFKVGKAVIYVPNVVKEYLKIALDSQGRFKPVV